MSVPKKDHIGPDLIRYDLYIIFAAQLGERKYLFPGPYSAAGIVRRAKYRSMYTAAPYLFLHIFKIHAPDTQRILFQRGVDDIISAVPQTVCKSDICGRVQENVVAFRTEYSQR